MDSYLLKLMVEKQNELRKQYYQNKKSQYVIRTICDKRYKSKGSHTIEEIKKELENLGYLDEVKLTQNIYGELCYESISIK